MTITQKDKIGGKTLQKIDFKTFINGVGNDLKIAIDDLTGIIIEIKEDMEKRFQQLENEIKELKEKNEN